MNVRILCIILSTCTLLKTACWPNTAAGKRRADDLIEDLERAMRQEAQRRRVEEYEYAFPREEIWNSEEQREYVADESESQSDSHGNSHSEVILNIQSSSQFPSLRQSEVILTGSDPYIRQSPSLRTRITSNLTMIPSRNEYGFRMNERQNTEASHYDSEDESSAESHHVLSVLSDPLRHVRAFDRILGTSYAHGGQPYLILPHSPLRRPAHSTSYNDAPDHAQEDELYASDSENESSIQSEPEMFVEPGDQSSSQSSQSRAESEYDSSSSESSESSESESESLD